MKKEKTMRVSNWHDLVDFVESVNPNNKTIVLTGWINNMYEGTTYINELVFTTTDIDILRKKNVRKTKKVVSNTVPKDSNK